MHAARSQTSSPVRRPYELYRAVKTPNPPPTSLTPPYWRQRPPEVGAAVGAAAAAAVGSCVIPVAIRPLGPRVHVSIILGGGNACVSERASGLGWAGLMCLHPADGVDTADSPIVRDVKHERSTVNMFEIEYGAYLPACLPRWRVIFNIPCFVRSSLHPNWLPLLHSIDYYRQAGPRSGVSWCVRVRAEILRAIVANQCLPPHVNHPNFEARFMPCVQIACNMVHGDDFASVVRPHFDRLVKHYARRWVVANGIVLEDKSVADRFRFNQELVARCFGHVDTIERWLRQDMGKLDWWEKVARDPGLIAPSPTPYHPSTAVATPNRPTPATPTTPTMPTTPVAQSRPRRGTSTSSMSMSMSTSTATATAKWRRPPQTPTHHKRGPDAAELDRLVSSLEALRSPSDPGVSQPSSTPTRCPPGPPSGLLSDPASGSVGENRGQMPAAVVSHSSVPVEDAIPVLGPELWAPMPKAAVPDLEPSWVMFPPSPAPSHASAKAPSSVLPSAERSVFPTVGAAPSTLVSVAAPPLPRPSSLRRRFQGSHRPPPPPTTILTEGAIAEAPSVVEAPAQDLTHDDYAGNGDGCDGGNGVDGGDDTTGIDNAMALEDHVRESLESMRLAWRYVVEIEAAAQLVMFDLDETV
ncbi:hypothetical protein CH63R_14549 [Colletotrichum higginsianum IMI 349063]|uniref:Uncharacterized protein n=1 Tax=Colletotrichum higginsianum (strain IMI 349063) TaxID=759273 RepID=A0A1B7XQE5_COLHI|nr:hypothetical protein CH63R_14549 [Colletotrichum higginsianum IMI 349063]OBR01977.1 hypothetical protein CH63R_14549 [Colletotrichum higginsianum IMI 349063]